MDFYSANVNECLKNLNSDRISGLTEDVYQRNVKRFGHNELSEKKKKSFISKVFDAIKEPMILILIFSYVVAFGISLGKFIKTGNGDFKESIGILLAVVISVSITLIMEGSSEKAFSAIRKIGDNITVKVIRDGQTVLVNKNTLTVGDVVFIESGDKIVADGRVIEDNVLSVDESALTGESKSVKKYSDRVLSKSTPLAERVNCVYSGTFVSGGSGKMVVTAIGDKTEIGGIAKDLQVKEVDKSPLQHKLDKLGKTITITGSIIAIIVFALSLARHATTTGLTFSTVQELFINCIILIVATVPEGLPTIVAVSLALNMIKLAKQNALIKKMTATETAGAVSVICSDKTGTITVNKLTVNCVCKNKTCNNVGEWTENYVKDNIFYNRTAKIIKNKGKTEYSGDANECALLSYTKCKSDYNSEEIIYREPFSSQTKCMLTVIKKGVNYFGYIKGAPEVILEKCNLSYAQKIEILGEIKAFQQKTKRVICFAHVESSVRIENSNVNNFIYDGYVVLSDVIRKEVYKSVITCKKAGINVKIITGDNRDTAFSIAKELKIAESESQVLSGNEVENMTNEELIKVLPKITVIARSTPKTKLKVVKALKRMGEVVAVTGDGINDAPAIKHADIGFSMGKTGSEISREASDVVLLDDSFDTIVRAICFGRNVYRNLQRFIMFQLSVNVSALLFITICTLLNLNQPFNTLQLLWINVIMDGPPALTLGLGNMDETVMNEKPVKKNASIVNGKMLFVIVFNGIFTATILFLQYFSNFLGCSELENKGVIFSLFVLIQLFNAINCTSLGKESVFYSLRKNKIMVLTFAFTFIVHIVIVKYLYGLFGISPLTFITFLKVLAVSFSIVIITETYRFIYRKIKAKRINKKLFGAYTKII